MMKRCYYIANAYDGAYFVLTDNLQEYAASMGSYVLNLQGSKKVNHYTFGSVEMSASEYERYRTEARQLEKSLVDQKKQEKELAAHHQQPDSSTDSETTNKKTNKGHLRLV